MDPTVKNPLTSILDHFWPIATIVKGVHQNLANPVARRHTLAHYHVDAEMFRFYPIPDDAGVVLEVTKRYVLLFVLSTGYQKLNWREVSLLASGVEQWKKDPWNLWTIPSTSGRSLRN